MKIKTNYRQPKGGVNIEMKYFPIDREAIDVLSVAQAPSRQLDQKSALASCTRISRVVI